MLRLAKIALLSLVLFSFPFQVKAVSEFKTEFDSTYSVALSGTTDVNHKILITNNLSHIYTTKYTISIGSRLQSAKVTVGGQDTNFTSEVIENSTTLNIDIDHPSIGKDQVTEINISYSSPDIAEHYGRVWEINIPRLSKANEANLYTRTILVPLELGPSSTESPQPTNVMQDNAVTKYFYQGLPNDSITLLFGESQLYQLELTYNLANPTVSSTDTEIALPPETAYQHVTLDTLTPAPKNMVLDKDGNWLAIYPLKSQENKVVKAKLYLTVYPHPFQKLPIVPSKALLSQIKYWEANSAIVSSLAEKLKTPLNFYNYLTENFSYAYDRVGVGAERLGAERALANPEDAICTEFTDTFVALARSAGEVNGYAHTTNSNLKPLGLETDVLHSWPEYYDKNQETWVAIDPTWGKTTGGIDYFNKMDFSHLAFVIHGQESSYPYPAGAYKKDLNEKTIAVTLADTKVEDHQSYSLEDDKDGSYIVNTGNVALIDYKVGLDSGKTITIKYLPPYGREQIQKDSILAKAPSLPIIPIVVSVLAVSLILFYVVSRRKK